ncbi:hypothetical protein HYE54_04005 [Aggregatibacter actinomycetemcomitans]|uniref:hypothetical protein n=1 Tax=Aggregatibacter actinomycetemcomitans TaxID=714 RepID=UPI00197C8BB8|nr:hypothetical protein [Aggregatibacter actinomycetemcomitans]MBN6067942.1 hypothetical protein [Aggregatibacter actinomycetemcomitans]MBN6085879.1 hypothetical protein [Aggregatibacter actinomycetemcomitans]
MYKVFPANTYIKDFIDKKTSDEDFTKLLDILEFMPNTRPYWGVTKYKYLFLHGIFYLYEIDELNKLVVILGIKFNNKRKTFNFARTPTQIRTIKKWINS